MPINNYDIENLEKYQNEVRIKNVTKDNQGEYECYGESDEGQFHARGVLKVICKYTITFIK